MSLDLSNFIPSTHYCVLVRHSKNIFLYTLASNKPHY
uniref:Uncharacterized protein n=1 Tax=Arundo donax TaxID=35708 RepID=A0A0A8YSQ8_ARUDO